MLRKQQWMSNCLAINVVASKNLHTSLLKIISQIETVSKTFLLAKYTLNTSLKGISVKFFPEKQEI